MLVVTHNREISRVAGSGDRAVERPGRERRATGGRAAPMSRTSAGASERPLAAMVGPRPARALDAGHRGLALVIASAPASSRRGLGDEDLARHRSTPASGGSARTACAWPRRGQHRARVAPPRRRRVPARPRHRRRRTSGWSSRRQLRRGAAAGRLHRRSSPARFVDVVDDLADRRHPRVRQTAERGAAATGGRPRVLERRTSVSNYGLPAHRARSAFRGGGPSAMSARAASPVLPVVTRPPPRRLRGRERTSRVLLIAAGERCRPSPALEGRGQRAGRPAVPTGGRRCGRPIGRQLSERLSSARLPRGSAATVTLGPARRRAPAHVRTTPRSDQPVVINVFAWLLLAGAALAAFNLDRPGRGGAAPGDRHRHGARSRAAPAGPAPPGASRSDRPARRAAERADRPRALRADQGAAQGLLPPAGLRPDLPHRSVRARLGRGCGDPAARRRDPRAPRGPRSSDRGDSRSGFGQPRERARAGCSADCRSRAEAWRGCRYATWPGRRSARS